MFDWKQRTEIYTMYEEYERLKRKDLAYDFLDVVSYIYKEVEYSQNNNEFLKDFNHYQTYFGVPIHYLMIDEV